MSVCGSCCAVDLLSRSLHVFASILEVQVAHGALLGRRLVQRLVADVVDELRLVVPEWNADVLGVPKRQVSTTIHRRAVTWSVRKTGTVGTHRQARRIMIIAYTGALAPPPRAQLLACWGWVREWSPAAQVQGCYPAKIFFEFICFLQQHCFRVPS